MLLARYTAEVEGGGLLKGKAQRELGGGFFGGAPRVRRIGKTAEDSDAEPAPIRCSNSKIGEDRAARRS